jgi:hypothetical protein
MYNDIKKIQKLVWKDDDMMNQETLFELQGLVAEFALKIANREKKTAQLLRDFPFLYESNTECGKDDVR